MPDYEDMHCQFEADQIRRSFHEGDFDSLRENNKIDNLVQKYRKMPQNNKVRIQEMEMINKIVNGKLLIGL